VFTSARRSAPPRSPGDGRGRRAARRADSFQVAAPVTLLLATRCLRRQTYDATRIATWWCRARRGRRDGVLQVAGAGRALRSTITAPTTTASGTSRAGCTGSSPAYEVEPSADAG